MDTREELLREYDYADCIHDCAALCGREVSHEVTGARYYRFADCQADNALLCRECEELSELWPDNLCQEVYEAGKLAVAAGVTMDAMRRMWTL